MANITYVGRHTAGIFLPGDVFVEHGATAEVELALAAELCVRSETDGSAQWVPADDESRAAVEGYWAQVAEFLAADQAAPADPAPRRRRAAADTPAPSTAEESANPVG